MADLTTKQYLDLQGLKTFKTAEDAVIDAKVKELADGQVKTNTDAIAAVKEDVDAFFKDADLTESAKDTLKELQEYIASDETAASAMAASIKQNTDAIAAEVERAEGAEAELQEAVEKAQEDATKANNDLAAEVTRATGVEGGLDTRISALEGAVGEGGSVDEQVDAKIAELDVEDVVIEGQYVSSVSEVDGKVVVTRTALPDYTDVYDAKGAADTAESNAKEYADSLAANYEVVGAAETAKTEAVETANEYADGLNDAMNARVEVLENTTYEAISTADIEALFATE